MHDLSDPRLIQLKGLLFLVLGILAGGILVVDHFSLRTTLLLGIAIWSFCRAYYCAFYVIEHYVDAEFRFAGLFDFFLYITGFRKNR